jgi:hypothetical protein
VRTINGGAVRSLDLKPYLAERVKRIYQLKQPSLKPPAVNSFESNPKKLLLREKSSSNTQTSEAASDSLKAPHLTFQFQFPQNNANAEEIRTQLLDRC